MAEPTHPTTLEACRIDCGPPLGALHVCATCGVLYQKVEDESRSPAQRCRCRPRRDDWRVWRGHDFNESTRLCDCCARVALRSGSRFSVWFCEACLTAIREAEGALGARAVPIGRHSFMNGGVRRHPQAAAGATPIEACAGADAESFARGLLSLVGSLGRVDVWKAVWTGRLYAAALPTVEEATLRRYLEAVERLRDPRFARARAVDGLLAHFGVTRAPGAAWAWSPEPPPLLPPRERRPS